MNRQSDKYISNPLDPGKYLTFRPKNPGTSHQATGKPTLQTGNKPAPEYLQHNTLNISPPSRRPASSPHSVTMCQPVAYTYPACGHLVVPLAKIWTLERCIRAWNQGKDCWIPQDCPSRFIVRKPWKGAPLDPCTICEERARHMDNANLAPLKTTTSNFSQRLRRDKTC